MSSLVAVNIWTRNRLHIPHQQALCLKIKGHKILTELEEVLGKVSRVIPTNPGRTHDRVPCGETFTDSVGVKDRNIALQRKTARQRLAAVGGKKRKRKADAAGARNADVDDQIATYAELERVVGQETATIAQSAGNKKIDMKWIRYFYSNFILMRWNRYYEPPC